MTNLFAGPSGPPPRAVVIPADVLAGIEAAARAAYPEECCGLLVGRSGPDTWTVARAVPSPNVAPPPRRDRFEIDPALLLRTQRALRGSGDIIAGHYHSHPNGMPRPSRDDASRAWQPNQIWLILAVSRAGAVDTRAWFRGSEEPASFAPLTLVPLTLVPLPEPAVAAP